METITPKVDISREFLEIAMDFSNPLDIVREAISNSFDAGASEIKIKFYVEKENGEDVLKILLEDNGEGMDSEGIQSFFDLGNSSRRDAVDKIGHKGHGTKVYFNSKKISIISIKNNKKYQADMEEPNRKLHAHEIPKANLSTCPANPGERGTKIIISGYNNNRRDKFSHDILKDYILWFTKIGSVEKEFGIKDFENVKLQLWGLGNSEFEAISFGHIFPEESVSVKELIKKHPSDAVDWYCKKEIIEEKLEKHPEIKFSAVFYIEGNSIKQSYNKMLRQRSSGNKGTYSVAERYGVWLCKDYIPIQRKNEWIISKGNEFIRFHAFINCQELRLTANRGSIENTPAELLDDLEQSVKKIFNNIVTGKDWKELEWVQSEVDSNNTKEKEKKSFKWRTDNIKKSRVALYKDVRLIEPQRESGVFSLFTQLNILEPDLFPFSIIDYDTHEGIDIIVKEKNDSPVKNSKYYYAEFKYYLSSRFNHSFENVHSIICWDIDKNLPVGAEIQDFSEEKRILKITPKDDDNDYTRYYLDNNKSERKIVIYVLKYFLEEKLNIKFNPRTNEDID